MGRRAVGAGEQERTPRMRSERGEEHRGVGVGDREDIVPRKPEPENI